MGELVAISLVSRTTGQGRVTLQQNDRAFAQLSVAEARAWAMNLLQAAEAAETDAVFMKFSRDDLGLDADQAGQFLIRLRNTRDLQGDQI